MQFMESLHSKAVAGWKPSKSFEQDVSVIEEALEDGNRGALAEAAMHLAAQIIERANEYRDKKPSLDEKGQATLARFGVDTSDPLNKAGFLRADPVIEGMTRRALMISSAVPSAEAAARLGVSASRLRQRIKEGTLLAIRQSRGHGWLIPAFQLTEDGELPHLSRVLSAATRSLSPEAVEQAFALPNEDLEGMSPRDWLLSGGDPASVQILVAGL
ncbi:hypothetical protein [Oceaniglobus trochenteri]|uniref:hypothetical protein n=1 Tax=Oceaniglobus trochenteri TaxID=2763260 RepID=UPI001CFFD982|nr:hypothetical protein [Oceaniglobus trochenteri]